MKCSMVICHNKGVIHYHNEIIENTLNPKDNATRAEVAVILYRFVDKLKVI